MAEPGFKPGVAGWEARMLPLRYAAPLQTLLKDDPFKARYDLFQREEEEEEEERSWMGKNQPSQI